MIRKLIQPNGYVMTVLQLLLPVWIYLAVTSGVSWVWWVASLVFYFIYLSIGNNVGQHRYFCHRYFEMAKPVELFVAWAACATGLGSPLSYAGVHVVHHKYHDTDIDPHGPKRGWKSMLYCFHRHLSPKDIPFTRNLTTLAARYGLLHCYYWLFVAGNAALIYLIFGWNALLFCYLLPGSLTLWAAAFTLLLQHDAHGASNTRVYQWFTWGESWHKNHHDDATLSNHAPKGKIDWTYQICRILSKSKK
jgi:sn-1 stearoyl-lipid 9-desaturase